MSRIPLGEIESLRGVENLRRLENRLDRAEHAGRVSITGRRYCCRRRDHLSRKGTRSNPFHARNGLEAFAFSRGANRPSWCRVDGELGKYFPNGRYEPALTRGGSS